MLYMILGESSPFEDLLDILTDVQRRKDWATERLREQGVHRCRNDLTLLDCCAETQWVKQYDAEAKQTLQTLATTYPDKTAHWFRC